jgi:DNA-binding transcriptional ArsR family regulator
MSMCNQRKPQSSRNRQAGTRVDHATFHPLRAEILTLLDAAGAPTTPTELHAALASSVSQRQLAYHLNVLRGAGYIDTTRGGRYRQA